MNLEKLKQALSCQYKKTISSPGRRPSAVLLPIFHRGDEYVLLFIKRTEKVRYHKGQISFPGGAYQKEDRTLLETALRETAEEVGIAPENVEVLGCLDEQLASGSDYAISPYVALIRQPAPLKPNRDEVSEIFEVPISRLLDEKSLRQETEVREGKEVIAYYYSYGERVVWGATARILAQFLEIVKGLEED